MPKEFGRSQRVASQMQKELAMIFQRDIRDPNLGLVTINEVTLSKDLAVAKVYFTVLNSELSANKVNQDKLNRMAPMVRHELARRMRLRHISELHFIYDHSMDVGLRVAEILQEVGGGVQSEQADQAPLAQDQTDH